MRKFQKLLAAAVAGALLSTSALGVAAVGRKDVFNAKYYADTYADLKAAFGYNEEALYKHYLTYGTKEGRKMTPVLDIVKYRETYKDLDKAFGDNWDAYVQHYFTFGMKEKRVSGGTFDPVAYAEAYSDIKKAFGNNYKAIINHYLTYGIREGRTAGVTIVTAPASGGGSSDDDEAPAPVTKPVTPPAQPDSVTQAGNKLADAVKPGADVVQAVAGLKELDKDDLSAALVKADNLANAKTVEDAYIAKMNAGKDDAKKLKKIGADNITCTDSNLPSNLKTASDITVVGVALNEMASEGAQPTLTLTKSTGTNTQASAVGTKLVIAADQVSAIDITLGGVANSSNLAFPITITMPVPTGMDADTLKVYHVDTDGNTQLLQSSVSDDKQKITFATKSFSAFAFVSGLVADEDELAKAVSADSALKNIRLLDGFTLTKTLQVHKIKDDTSNPRTIDFGGKTITGGAGKRVEIQKDANVVMVNGTLASDDQANETAILRLGGVASSGSKLTLGGTEDGTAFTVKGYKNGILIDSTAELVVEAKGVVDLSATSSSDSFGVVVGTSGNEYDAATKVTVKGTVKGKNMGLTVNGNKTVAAVITIEGSALVEATNAADNIGNGTGMYLAGANTTTISGGTVKGATGVEVRAGTLTISGGTIEGTGTAVKSRLCNGGNTVHGAALAVSQHNTKKPITVTMTAGTLTAASGGLKLYVTDALSDGSKADTTANTIQVTMPDGSELTTAETPNAKVLTGSETNVSGNKFSVKLTGSSNNATAPTQDETTYDADDAANHTEQWKEAASS